MPMVPWPRVAKPLPDPAPVPLFRQRSSCRWRSLRWRSPAGETRIELHCAGTTVEIALSASAAR